MAHTTETKIEIKTVETKTRFDDVLESWNKLVAEAGKTARAGVAMLGTTLRWGMVIAAGAGLLYLGKIVISASGPDGGEITVTPVTPPAATDKNGDGATPPKKETKNTAKRELRGMKTRVQQPPTTNVTIIYVEVEPPACPAELGSSIPDAEVIAGECHEPNESAPLLPAPLPPPAPDQKVAAKPQQPAKPEPEPAIDAAPGTLQDEPAGELREVTQPAAEPNNVAELDQNGAADTNQASPLETKPAGVAKEGAEPTQDSPLGAPGSVAGAR